MTYREALKQYDDMLDECYPDCKIGPYTYTISRAMKDVDQTAYRCGFDDWLDAEDITIDD